MKFIALFYIIAAYFLGAIPFSYLVGKLRGVDLLRTGSKSSGATNVYRTLGFGYAAFAFFLDAAKGYVAIFCASYILPGQHVFMVVCGLAAILGHTFTPFLKFKGGKGVATGVGVLFFIQPVIAMIGFLLEFIIIFFTRYVSLASILSALVILILAYLPFFQMPASYIGLITVAVIYIIYKHIPNIKRLIKGQENKV
ncbi:MAG: glycerol-3-phosphate 1-O-acyltransferase PlsY [Candidatus Margulisbacteria bacterium]|nr:glycerol-3-phosphate 1-O-acyltransferase PlsY [Candidatus Margulisiibacteriota bacterium]